MSDDLHQGGRRIVTNSSTIHFVASPLSSRTTNKQEGASARLRTIIDTASLVNPESVRDSGAAVSGICKKSLPRSTPRGLLFWLNQRLKLAEVSIFAAPGEQFGMCPLFDNSTSFEDDDPVGEPYRGQTVCNDQGGALPRRCFQ